ncbi:MAG TPA: hypothetical protein VK662_07850 [Acidothermaceae bacterium]|nr:hypothetical protein [Acidothermaceae bacterium]
MSDLPPLTRRTALRLLVVGTVGLLAGCRSAKHPAAAPATSGSTSPAGGSHTPSVSPAVAVASPTLSPDEALAHRVALAEAQLIGAYDDATRDHPELAALLAPLRADHAAHADALVSGIASSPPPSASPSTALPSSAPPSAPVVGGVGAGAGAAAAPPSSPPASPSPSSVIIGQLIALERAAAAARVTDLVTTSGSLARLLASIGGCEAAHAALLSVAA